MTRTGKRFLVMLLLLVLAAVVVLVVVQRRSDAQPAGRAHRGDGFRELAIPVNVAPVTRRDVRVYLNGLGTVQAYNTVTVRPQVSGQLIRVPFKQGDEVRKGQLLAEIDPRTYQAALDQSKAKLLQDQAQLLNAQQNLTRFTKLAPAGYVSGQQLDQQKQLVSQYRAAVAADRAAIEVDAIQLSRTKITAPISGRLGMRLVDVGNIVTAGETNGIVVVTQVKPIFVDFTLPEQDLRQLRRAGAQVPVTVLDRSNSHELASGTLTAINNQIDQATGTIELKATFANPKEALWPGQFVNVRVLVDTLRQVPVVPVTAVQQGPNGTYVYLLAADRTVAMQPVGVGASQGGFSQITKGLETGQQVVVDGQYRLKPGARVKAQQVTPVAAASVAVPAPTGP